MTKKEWLDRCEMVYDLGFYRELDIAQKGIEFMIRFKAGQWSQSSHILEMDKLRSRKILSNDTEAYDALQAMHILSKKCQKCATMPDAWHSRNCSFGCEIN